jgi:NAD(P)-dependent dehydrogenase (short-subunit alcohol dehydrogenase family)
MTVNGKLAVVTGGSSGIGYAIARRLAVEGATVAIFGSGFDKARSAADEIAGDGHRANPFAVDVSDADQVEETVNKVRSQLGEIDILINSAGVWYETPIGSTSWEAFDRMVGVNLKGPFLLANAIAPAMKERRSGKIVNLASVAGLSPSAGYSIYSTVKAGIIMFTRALSLELAPFDINVNAIAPGNTATPMNEHVRTGADFAARREWITRITPSNRPFTPPEEIAETALFLVDDRVRGMHGATIVVDEGRSAGLPSR